MCPQSSLASSAILQVPGCSSSLAPSIQSMNQYSRRWISLCSLTICAQLVAGPAPAELPTPVSLHLVGECMRFYVIKSRPFKLRVFKIFSPQLPLFIYALCARSSRNLSLMLQSSFFLSNVAVCKT